jgi:hypothetical protein
MPNDVTTVYQVITIEEDRSGFTAETDRGLFLSKRKALTIRNNALRRYLSRTGGLRPQVYGLWSTDGLSIRELFTLYFRVDRRLVS